MSEHALRTIGKLGFQLGILPVMATLCFVSCARVQVSDAYKGVVVDAENDSPLANVILLVRVMRVSSFDGTSQFATYTYRTNERGEFTIPARKKFVDSVTERMEEMHYFEFLAFGRSGYQTMEFRTDDERGTFSWSNPTDQPIVIRLKKVEAKPAR